MSAALASHLVWTDLIHGPPERPVSQLIRSTLKLLNPLLFSLYSPCRYSTPKLQIIPNYTSILYLKPAIKLLKLKVPHYKFL